MAMNVVAQVIGGQKKVIDNVRTVGDVRASLGGLGPQYRGSVNGTPASDSDGVSDGSYVSFSEAVKGANA